MKRAKKFFVAIVLGGTVLGLGGCLSLDEWGGLLESHCQIDPTSDLC